MHRLIKNFLALLLLYFPYWWSTKYILIQYYWKDDNQGPVVQSVVSLMSSFRVISLTILADSIYSILIFFAEKMWVASALQKQHTFFSKKFQHICISLDVNFNESLTNDIVSFEQLGPNVQNWFVENAYCDTRTKKLYRCSLNCVVFKAERKLDTVSCYTCFHIYRMLVRCYSSGPSCSKRRELNELVSGQNINCSSKYSI